MNDIMETFYLRYMECLNTNSKDICDKFYLNIPSDKEKKHKDTWRFVNRGNFVKK